MVSRAPNTLLPAELIDQVIDHLYDDIPSLQACCLTSRGFLPGARFHIFHDVLLSGPDRANAFVKLLEGSPHISSFVNFLGIKGDACHIYSKADYLDTVLPIIAPKLTQLRSLRMDKVTLAHASLGALSALIYQFPALKELQISSVTFERFRDFAALIVAHPLLECLDLGHVWWKGSIKSPSHWEHVFLSYLDSRSQLRRISLNDTASDVVDWISSHYRVLPVHTVTHGTIATCLFPQMTKFLNAIGSSLEHLTFSIEPLSSPLDLRGLLYFYETCLILTQFSDLENAALISSNTRLCSLTIGPLLLIHRTSYAWIPILLSQVTSRNIKEISFNLVWNRLEILEAMELERIQDVLTKDVFRGLDKVVFRIMGSVDPVEGGRGIRRRMDRLAGRGRLVVCREDDSIPIII